MDKTKPDETLSGGPIAKRIVGKMKLHWQRKVANIKNVIGWPRDDGRIQKTVVSQKELAGSHFAHAAYVYTQNQVSVISEQLTALKEMAPFAEIISRAEDLYVPSAPPMSPLTTSYFTCWAFFDACAGRASETIGSTILEVGAIFGMHPDLLRLIRLMQDSRMGFYIHRGWEGDASVLEDLVTGAACPGNRPGRLQGTGRTRTGTSVCFRRRSPGPRNMWPSRRHTSWCTRTSANGRPASIERSLMQRASPDYERHMKYGPTREYWNDYVFEAYVNHQADAIYLAGLPDIPESRPHSEVSERNGWKAPAFLRQN